jgi:proprotein convertase subtilisin/kexin type 5
MGSNVCTACPTGAATCTAAATHVTCNTGYYLATATCTACSAGVATCSSSTALTCNTGFYLTSTTCTACSAGVATCSSSTALTCNTGFYLTTTTCTACTATLAAACTTCQVYPVTAGSASWFANLSSSSCVFIPTSDTVTATNGILSATTGAVTGCNNGFFWNTAGNSNAGSCLACTAATPSLSVANCATCS